MLHTVVNTTRIMKSFRCWMELYGVMVVHMRRPHTVEGYRPCCVHCAHKEVLQDNVAFAQSKELFSSLETMQCEVPALAHSPSTGHCDTRAVCRSAARWSHCGKEFLQRSSVIEMVGDCIGEEKRNSLVGIVEGWNCVAV